jgi:hypothetical protein
MPALVTSLVFAVLVATIPFTFVLKVLLQLPRPLASAHQRWPMPLTFLLIGLITAYVAIFIHQVYYGPQRPAAVGAEFLIVALAYGFALALVLRQFGGVYPDYIVTTGATGFGLRKTIYRNIRKVEKLRQSAGETRFRIETVHGNVIFFSLPNRYVSIFHDQLKKKSE